MSENKPTAAEKREEAREEARDQRAEEARERSAEDRAAVRAAAPRNPGAPHTLEEVRAADPDNIELRRARLEPGGLPPAPPPAADPPPSREDDESAPKTPQEHADAIDAAQKALDDAKAAAQPVAKFPSVRYHPDRKPIVVQSEQEAEQLGEGWTDAPHFETAPAAPDSVEGAAPKPPPNVQ